MGRHRDRHRIPIWNQLTTEARDLTTDDGGVSNPQVIAAVRKWAETQPVLVDEFFGLAVAAEYSRWSQEHCPGEGGVQLGLFEPVVRIPSALTALARASGDPAWLVGHSAEARVAVHHELAERALRMLSSLRPDPDLEAGAAGGELAPQRRTRSGGERTRVGWAVMCPITTSG